MHSIYTIEKVSDSPASTNNGAEAGHITADNDDIITHPEGIVNTLDEKVCFLTEILTFSIAIE